ncbi:PKD domain-containing protein [Pinibacter soli]|uniref:PKD domain-containing protein n=1 Tax=Pinibacter soli TaxID=3044211 RepID=A0ABT6RI67_9BACT|nr:PKD domain-containing protein [Pinibacter soli]MDI3322272.1 PKD domain-containing protein [Pinibacter soli]
MRYLIFLLATVFSLQLQAQQTIENNISAVVDCGDRTAFVFSDTDPQDEWQVVEWSFGDGTMVNEMPVPASIAHKYGVSNSATYVVSLKKKNVITQQFSIASRTVFVVNEQPSFTVDVLETCLQNKVTFVPLGIKSQYINKYQWDFGDGKLTVKTNTKLSPKFDASVSYAFDDPGIYNVQLAIVDTNSCSRTFEYPNVIHIRGPVAKFKATSVTSCKEENFTRTIKDASVPDKTAAINKWEWYVWETGTSGPADPTAIFDGTHPMNADGVVFPFSNTNHAYKGYSIKLIVTDNEGCISAAKTSSSYIKSYWPKASFEAEKTLLCNENDVKLKDASTGNKLNYTWVYGDGETGSTSVSHSHTYLNTGLYSVKLAVAEKQMNTCKDEVVKDNYIKIVNVKAAFEMIDSKQCGPVPVSFIDHSIGAASYNWDFGDGPISAESQPVHSFEAGDHPITLTVKSPQNECSSSATMPLHIYQKPDVSIEGEEVICLEKNVTALDYKSAINGSDSPISFNWEIDGVTLGNEANFTNDYRLPGAHNLKLTVDAADYCSGTAEKNIKIDSIAPSFMAAASVYSVKTGENIILHAGATGDNLQFNWYPQTGLSCYDCANPVFNSTASTQYRLTASTPEGCAVEKDIVITVIKNIDVPVNSPCTGIAMPNAFTPNGDGQNEVFYVKGCSIVFVKKFSIYDRLGRRVFMRENFLPNDKHFGWDGKVNGVHITQAETFVYLAEVVDKQGKPQSLKGTVILVK